MAVSRLSVAIVHDYLVDSGGAERALLELHRLFPGAPIYTAIFSPATTRPEFAEMDIRTSFLQTFRPTVETYKALLPLYPVAFASMALHRYDVVVSSSSAFSKCVRPAPRAVHLCYCYTPPRFLYRWDSYREQERLGGLESRFIEVLQPYLRWWDQRGAQRVNRFMAISQTVRARILQNYGQPADVVYPPIDLTRPYASEARDGYYLVVSRLLPYKGIDLVVKTFSSIGRRLVVVGDGPDRARLESAAGPNVRFLGRVTDQELAETYRRCRATILPGEEDLGLTPLEANAAGSPVIALGRGGATETVVPGVTGVLYREPTIQDLAAAVSALESTQFDHNVIRRHAERFSRGAFQRDVMATLERALVGRPASE